MLGTAGSAAHRPAPARADAAVDRARRGHELAAVPGDPGEARARLLRLLLHLAFADTGMFGVYAGCAPQPRRRGARAVPRRARRRRRDGAHRRRAAAGPRARTAASLVLGLEDPLSRMSPAGQGRTRLRRAAVGRRAARPLRPGHRRRRRRRSRPTSSAGAARARCGRALRRRRTCSEAVRMATDASRGGARRPGPDGCRGLPRRRRRRRPRAGRRRRRRRGPGAAARRRRRRRLHHPGRRARQRALVHRRRPARRGRHHRLRRRAAGHRPRLARRRAPRSGCWSPPTSASAPCC